MTDRHQVNAEHRFQELVAAVERTGEEVPVTLFTGGGILMGWLTPGLRYRRWVQEHAARARVEGCEVYAPPDGREWTGADRSEVLAAWAAAASKHAQPNPEGGLEVRVHVATAILRDVLSVPTPVLGAWRIPFVVVTVDSVVAWVWGRPPGMP